MTDAELALDALERLGGKQVTFYVGVDGDDNNSGRNNVDEPLRSWQRVRELCLPGDRIIMADGWYILHIR